MKNGISVGIVGLGRMGLAIADRISKAHYSVFGYDTSKQSNDAAKEHGIEIVSSLQELAERASVIWLMVPHGAPVDITINDLLPFLRLDTIIIDGGNSYFKDSQARAALLASYAFDFLDCGTSGGLHGHQQGFCLMVGGKKEAYDRVEQLLSTIASPGGLAYVGPSGAGHYVKMVHNGIEYGILQAYAEGLHVLKAGSFAQVPIDLSKVADLWDHGSIIRSWILSLMHNVLQADQGFEGISGQVDEGGTGRWAAQEAEEHGLQVPVLDAALAVRVASQLNGGDWTTKLIALTRHEFGGHSVHHEDTRADS